jgi:hypothetical protein
MTGSELILLRTLLLLVNGYDTCDQELEQHAVPIETKHSLQS